MRVEKKPSVLEYWEIFDDNWPSTVIVGIEHREEEVYGVMINNKNSPEKGIRSLSGAELLAILKVVDASRCKVKDINIKMLYIS